MNELTKYLTDISEGVRGLSELVSRKRLGKAQGFARAGMYAEACQEIEGHNFSEPLQRVQAALLLAKVFAQQGMYDRASIHWKQVLRIDPENKEALSGLAAISKQFARPPLQRVWGFFAASVMLVTLIALLVLFIDRRIYDVDSRILTTSTETHDLTLQQSSKITEDIQRFKETYTEELAIATSGINSLRENVVRSEKQVERTGQALQEQINLALAGVQKETTLHYQALHTQLSNFKTNTDNRMATLAQNQEKRSAHLQERLGEFESTLLSVADRIQLTNQSFETQKIQDRLEWESVTKYLDNIEKELSAMRTTLLQLDPKNPPGNSENIQN